MEVDDQDSDGPRASLRLKMYRAARENSPDLLRKIINDIRAGIARTRRVPSLQQLARNKIRREMAGCKKLSRDMVARWLKPDFNIVCVCPFGLLDYGSATLRCKILIPSFPWIAPGWRAWGRNPSKGRDQNFAA